ncbi:hypothetical protein ACNVED_03520 [Legionella sp. D16C41]|uniref:hypothetical protein n=1 Tax=Legionella sp. D16C41 TaxID=3402688 RepID=UPI003AF6D943
MRTKIQYQERDDSILTPKAARVYTCLDNKDVITSKVSDHHLILHDNVIFWNVMMQAKKRRTGFNNGFAMVEDEAAYRNRLIQVANVIAEAVYRNPTTEAICLCEGPIQEEDLKVLYNTLKSFPWMQRFISNDMFHKPAKEGPNWGLLMLADTRYTVTKIELDPPDEQPNLINRFQLWQLKYGDVTKYVALAHFPFLGDANKTEKLALSAHTQLYCNFIQTILNKYAEQSLIFCADFNFNPYLIGKPVERVLDQIASHNSIILNTEEKTGLFNVDTVTVDGVLLSQREKQNLSKTTQRGLIPKLKYEHRFFQPVDFNVIDAMRKNENDQTTLRPRLLSQAG